MALDRPHRSTCYNIPHTFLHSRHLTPLCYEHLYCSPPHLCVWQCLLYVVSEYCLLNEIKNLELYSVQQLFLDRSEKAKLV